MGQAGVEQKSKKTEMQGIKDGEGNTGSATSTGLWQVIRFDA